MVIEGTNLNIIGAIYDKPYMSFPGGSVGKESAYTTGNLATVPGLGRPPGGGHSNPLQYSCRENPHGQSSLAVYSL